MLANFKSNQKYIFFYFTLIYLISFLFWWTFLLYKKTVQHHSDSLENQILIHTQNNSPLDSYLNSTDYEKELDKFKRERIMIITESIVFSIVLFLLVYKVKKSVEHEIKMSQQQQNFILSITHELKSPLSSIKLMSQTLAKHNLNNEQKDRLISNSLTEVNRLQNLVENVLLAAKIDNDKYGFVKNELNLSALINSLIKTCETALNTKIESHIEKDIKINADKSGMTSIIINLIENAIKYSDNNAFIEVLLKKENDKIIFKVIDNGIGIIREERKKIFTKFYRVGNEETRKSKGTGLGLYIVKKLVEFHNGHISVYANKPKGSIFEIIFEL